MVAPVQPPTTACWAPRRALYLQPDGVVRACCATGHRAGTVFGPDRQTLREIWDGAALAAQRDALDQHQFHLGCQECELAIATGGRRASLAGEFDRYRDSPELGYPSHIDFALSSRCNLQCVMCNGSLSSAIRAQREHRPPLPAAYDEAFFDELSDFLPHLERAQFKGGEPFLARENRRIWDELIDRGLRPEISVTTNGTILDEHVERYVTELRMHLIVSVDAMDPGLLERTRVGVEASRLWANLDRLGAISDRLGSGITLSFCLMSTTWRETVPILAECERRGLHPNIVLVHQPAEFDLLRRPADELAVVVKELTAGRAVLASGAARRELDAVIRRIHQQIEHPVVLEVHDPEGLLPYEDGAGPTQPPAPIEEARWPVPSAGRPTLDDAEQAALATRLASEAGGAAPVVVEYEQGAVRRIVPQPWAAWLDVATWIGAPMGELTDHLERQVGAAVSSSPMREVTPALTVLDVSIPSRGRDRIVRVHLFSDARTGEPRSMLTPIEG